jgi:hypothetical protein
MRSNALRLLQFACRYLSRVLTLVAIIPFFVSHTAMAGRVEQANKVSGDIGHQIALMYTNQLKMARFMIRNDYNYLGHKILLDGASRR